MKLAFFIITQLDEIFRFIPILKKEKNRLKFTYRTKKSFKYINLANKQICMIFKLFKQIIQNLNDFV